jgi:hypothetical protein
MENKRCGGIAAPGLARGRRTNERTDAPAAISCTARAFFVSSLAGGQQRASSPSPARRSRSHLQDASQPSPRRPQLSAHCSLHPALAAIVGCRGTEARSLISSWCFSASQANLTPGRGRTSLLQHSAPSILKPSTPVVRCCPFAPAIASVVRASVAVAVSSPRSCCPLSAPALPRPWIVVVPSPRDNTPPPPRRLLAAA